MAGSSSSIIRKNGLFAPNGASSLTVSLISPPRSRRGCCARRTRRRWPASGR
jgi:hypothetical protein